MTSEQSKIKIAEKHVDSFGHVNNAAYLEMFEWARWELINHKGYDLNRIQELQQGPVILEVHLKFLKEVFKDEEVTIETKTLSYEGKVGKLSQKMFKADGSLACDATMSIGLFDLQQRKLIAPTPEWKKVLGIH